jgi:hypothetical protein
MTQKTADSPLIKSFSILNPLSAPNNKFARINDFGVGDESQQTFANMVKNFNKPTNTNHSHSNAKASSNNKNNAQQGASLAVNHKKNDNQDERSVRIEASQQAENSVAIEQPVEEGYEVSSQKILNNIVIDTLNEDEKISDLALHSIVLQEGETLEKEMSDSIDISVYSVIDSNAEENQDDDISDQDQDLEQNAVPIIVTTTDYKNIETKARLVENAEAALVEYEENDANLNHITADEQVLFQKNTQVVAELQLKDDNANSGEILQPQFDLNAKNSVQNQVMQQNLQAQNQQEQEQVTETALLDKEIVKTLPINNISVKTEIIDHGVRKDNHANSIIGPGDFKVTLAQMEQLEQKFGEAFQQNNPESFLDESDLLKADIDRLNDTVTFNVSADKSVNIDASRKANIAMQVSNNVKNLLNLDMKISNAQNIVTVKLSPEELGNITIQIISISENGNNKINNIKIIAEKNDTHLLLQQSQQELEKSLKEVVGSKESYSLQFEMNQGTFSQGNGNPYFASSEEREQWKQSFLPQDEVNLSNDDAIDDSSVSEKNKKTSANDRLGSTVDTLV